MFWGRCRIVGYFGRHSQKSHRRIGFKWPDRVSTWIRKLHCVIDRIPVETPAQLYGRIEPTWIYTGACWIGRDIDLAKPDELALLTTRVGYFENDSVVEFKKI